MRKSRFTDEQTIAIFAANRDPRHERHAEITEWHGADFDPAVVDADTMERALAALARRWSRSPRTPKTK